MFNVISSYTQQITLSIYKADAKQFYVKKGQELSYIMGDHCYNTIYRYHPDNQMTFIPELSNGYGMHMLIDLCEDGDVVACTLQGYIDEIQNVLEESWGTTLVTVTKEKLNYGLIFIPGYDNKYVNASNGGSTLAKKQPTLNKNKKTAEHIIYKGRKQCIYLGKRGGKYIKTRGKYVSLRSIK
jgi:hypothetical protein